MPSNPPPADALLIDKPTMARRLSIGVRTLEKHAVAGTIPCVRLGRRLLFDPIDVAAAIQRLKGGGV